MGLGKSLTTLALIAADKEEREATHTHTHTAAAAAAASGGGASVRQKERRTTLIVCPLSVLSSWEEQVKQHIRSDDGLSLAVST